MFVDYIPLKIAPIFKTVYVGSSVKFECYSYLKVNWYHNGKLVSENCSVGYSNQTHMNWLSILDVDHEDTGHYVCSSSKYPRRYGRARLNVLDLPNQSSASYQTNLFLHIQPIMVEYFD